MTIRTLAAAMLILAVAACGREPTEAELGEIRSAATVVLQAHPGNDPVPAAEWPAAIARLEPESVRTSREGLYIKTGSSFVRERGLFVPRSAYFLPSPGSDPSHTVIGDGVYAYRIDG